MSLKLEVYALLNNASRLCQDCPDAKELLACLSEMRQRLEIPLRVAVVGIMKAGKSTFMNALMGEDILYTGNLETTYTVGWFCYAPEPSITVCFRDGETLAVPFDELEKWSVRSFEKENPRINNVKYLKIHYPAPILKHLEFIDTPGLNSIYGTDARNTLDFLSIKGSEDTLYEASTADAVIYAFNRTMADFDKEILDSFHSGGEVFSSPINSIGILTKADAGGIWDIFSDMTPVEAAKAVTSNIMEKADMKNLLFSVLPVCAKVIEGCTQLEETDWDVLKQISRIDSDSIKDMLCDAEQFINGEDAAQVCGGREDRERLIRLVGQYGILEISKQLRLGKTKAEIEQILRDKCGIQDIQELLENHFGNRTFLIKTQYVFKSIREILSRLLKKADTSRILKNICEQINEDIDLLISSVQSLKELKLLQMYYNGQLSFVDADEEQDFLRVTGEYGRSVESRLGAGTGKRLEELEQIAKDRADFWHGRAADWMMPGNYVEAASTLARSYETMYYHLNCLCEE